MSRVDPEKQVIDHLLVAAEIIEILATIDPGMRFRPCWHVYQGADGRWAVTLRGTDPLGVPLAVAFRRAGLSEMADTIEALTGDPPNAR